MKNILLVPSIKQIYQNQFEITVDLKLLNFINYNFPKAKINIATNIFKKVMPSFDLLVLAGGNNLVKFSKKFQDKIRSKIDSKYYKMANNLNVPILGICYGAQFIANQFDSTLIKTKKHIGKHKIIMCKSILKKKTKIVNSYHRYAISNLGKELISLAQAQDKSIEAFIHENNNILGIMWHPERNKNYSKIDRYLIKKLCN